MKGNNIYLYILVSVIVAGSAAFIYSSVNSQPERVNQFEYAAIAGASNLFREVGSVT